MKLSTILLNMFMKGKTGVRRSSSKVSWVKPEDKIKCNTLDLFGYLVEGKSYTVDRWVDQGIKLKEFPRYYFNHIFFQREDN